MCEEQRVEGAVAPGSSPEVGNRFFLHLAKSRHLKHIQLENHLWYDG